MIFWICRAKRNALKASVQGLLVIGVLLSCNSAFSLTTKVRDLLNHPRDFEGKQITIYGTVTNAVSLLLIKYYEIQDDTGSIKVITDKLLPGRGEKLRVTGTMTVVELGTERFVVLRESDSGPTVASPDRDPNYFSNSLSASNPK